MEKTKEAIFGEFKIGTRNLFAVKAKGKPIADLQLFDISFQKVPTGVSIMLWEKAEEAEKFILSHGLGEKVEAAQVNFLQLLVVVKNIFGPDTKNFGYMLY